MIPVKMFVRLMDDNYDAIVPHMEQVGLKYVLTHYVDIQFNGETPCRVKYVHMPDDPFAFFFLDSPHFCYYTKVLEIESSINFDSSNIGKVLTNSEWLRFNLKAGGRVVVEELDKPDFDYTVYDGTDRTDAEDMIMRFILENDQ